MITFSGRRASQDASELSAFVKLLNERGVKRYLEIGARHGDTFHYVMTRLPPKSFGVALDLPGGVWGKNGTQEALMKACADLVDKDREIHYIFGDSRDPDTIGRAAALGPYDAVLIDGDHRYAGVSADWMNYRGMASLVAFHDIVGTGQRDNKNEADVEVPRLWAKIKASHKATHTLKEFVSLGSKMGIGACISRS